MPYEGVKAMPPPRTGTGSRPAAAASVSASGPAPGKALSRKGKDREEAANGIGQIIAFGCMVAGQLADSGAIGLHWPGAAHEAAVIAETDTRMASALDHLLEVGPYGNFIIALLPLAGQVLVNHKIVKAEAMAGMGVVHPDVLEAQVKAEMAAQRMRAIQMQAAAEAELEQMQAAMSAAAAANGSGSQTEKVHSV